MTNTYPTEFDRYLFHKGEHYQSYNFLGSHISKNEYQNGVRFSIWAPNAKKISVVGDFNDWQDDVHNMIKI